MTGFQPCGELTYGGKRSTVSALSVGSEIYTAMGANVFAGMERVRHRVVFSANGELAEFVPVSAFHTGDKDSEQSGDVPVGNVVTTRRTRLTAHSSSGREAS